MVGGHGEDPDAVRAVVASLRQRRNSISGEERSHHQARVVRAFAAFAGLWERRLAHTWQPPECSAFPWAQVRLSLAALLPGFRHAQAQNGNRENGAGLIVALILAGNTPLLAWAPLAAALLAGHAVFIKQSRDELLWTRLFVESLSEVDVELASRIHLDLWPGEDPRTTALVQAADAVIAYGGDTTLAALRRIVPNNIPFFPFGHAVSIGIIASADEDTRGFARDVLMYDQAGCLSPHVLFVLGEPGEVTDALAEGFRKETEVLDIPPVTDPAAAIAVRQARDLANFEGQRFVGDSSLRWTIIQTDSGDSPAPAPVGHGVVFIVPSSEADGGDILHRLGPLRCRISSVGVAGQITAPLREILYRDGVSRICPAGQMQTPPLDWPNGSTNLQAELLKIRRNTEVKTVDGLA